MDFDEGLVLVVDSDFDDFDYVDGSLTEWANVYGYDSFGIDGIVELIEAEYLPRFEAAIHRLHSTNSGAWSHPYVRSRPFDVVVVDVD